MLEKVKMSLRITHDEADEELIALIEACKLDLKTAGINKIDETDPLVAQAIIRYCKANWGFNADGYRFQRTYDALKNSLRMAVDAYV